MLKSEHLSSGPEALFLPQLPAAGSIWPELTFLTSSHFRGRSKKHKEFYNFGMFSLREIRNIP